MQREEWGLAGFAGVPVLRNDMVTSEKRETYRHGNVRSEAIDAGFSLVRAQGLGALSVRQIASALGVAHRSLYNHFADREALLDAIAERGFKELGRRLQKCRTRADYVRVELDFALKEPHLYDLLQSRPHSTMKDKPSLRAAAHLCVGEAMRLFSREGRGADENRRAVMKVLMLMHGSISMYRGGILDLPNDAAFVAEMQKIIKTEG
jgi:AcrR family transcriptional regulator